MAGKKRETSESTPSSYPWRPPDEATYAVVRQASLASGLSMNTILSNAVSYYVHSGGLTSDLAKARAAQDEAIRKLGGSDVP